TFGRVVDENAAEVAAVDARKVELADLRLALRQVLEVDDGDAADHARLVEQYELECGAGKLPAKVILDQEGEPAAALARLQRVELHQQGGRGRLLRRRRRAAQQ